jgi:hypothetical protein
VDPRDIPAHHDSQEGRQAPSLFQRGGEPARTRRAPSAAALLYLGEINSSQEHSWRKWIKVLDEGGRGPRMLALFPEDHLRRGDAAPAAGATATMGQTLTGAAVVARI